MLAFGSEEMRVVADVCESTWADEQPDLTPFSFVLLLPEKVVDQEGQRLKSLLLVQEEEDNLLKGG